MIFTATLYLPLYVDAAHMNWLNGRELEGLQIWRAPSLGACGLG
jgi:hypothetical protein